MRAYKKWKKRKEAKRLEADWKKKLYY